MIRQALAKIDELNEAYLAVWEDVCSLESPTNDKAGVDACGAYIAEMARQRGFAVETLPLETAGNMVCITMNPDASAAPLTLSGHIDTVHAVGSFGSPACRKDSENLYGPGVMDCKGGVVAAFLAMDALRQCGYNARPIQLILQTDEEKNSNPSGKETLRWMIEKSKDSVAFLNCESVSGNTAVLERKGIVQFRFTVRGREIHSSRCHLGASAIREAAAKILRLEELKDGDGLTCNCGMISGGTAVNTVARACEFFADFRFMSAAQLEEARALVREVAEHSTFDGCTCQVEETSYRPAMEKSEKNFALLDALNRLYAENGLPTLTPRLSLGGSDAAYITDAGIPCIDSIGVAGDFIHTLQEYGELKSLAEAAKRIVMGAFL